MKYITLFFCILIIGAAIIKNIFFVVPSDNQSVTVLPESPSGEYVPYTDVHVIQSKTGSVLPAVELISNSMTEQLADDFYALSEDDETYQIYYHSGSGRITIMLFKEPLGFTRSFAEKRLKETLSFSEEELCDMAVTVSTNEFVNPGYTGINLGLSFCEGSLSLE